MKGDISKQKQLAIQLMEREILRAVAEHFYIDYIEAMARLYRTTTYMRYTAPGDFYGLAREGTHALICRVIYELEHGKPMVTSTFMQASTVETV